MNSFIITCLVLLTICVLDTRAINCYLCLSRNEADACWDQANLLKGGARVRTCKEGQVCQTLTVLEKETMKQTYVFRRCKQRSQLGCVDKEAPLEGTIERTCQCDEGLCNGLDDNGGHFGPVSVVPGQLGPVFIAPKASTASSLMCSSMLYVSAYALALGVI